MGGSRDPVTDSPANLALLCGSGTTGCHGLVEQDRAWALECGLLVRQSQDPREVDVSIMLGLLVLRLHEDGRRGVVGGDLVVWQQNPLLSTG